MKFKMMAVVLALTVMSWAQTATQTAPSTPQQSTVPAEKAKCPCCEKMASSDAKDAPSCCAHHDMKGHDMEAKDAKEMASCCAGKDAKSSDGKDGMACMKSDKDKAAASCCKDACGKDDASCGKDKTAAACCGNSCGKDGKKGCCSGKTEKTARNCCEDKLRG
jgi:hypothetical protein